MAKPKIFITGANGQLGKELKDLESNLPSFQFLFFPKDELPLHEYDIVRNSFRKHNPAYCINTAAYTAVDKAESEKNKAFLVNGEAVGVLGRICNDFNTKLIHFSSDYVFDGLSALPYKEDAPTNPINMYGKSKLQGENLCRQFNPASIILRTSWLYSSFGNNFVKTMMRLMKERKEINVVNDQVGSPTYASDLATAIIEIIKTGKWTSGIFHFSNIGKISWYEFAMVIKEITKSTCSINPIPGSDYPTPAKRPSFSLLDTTKFRTTFNIEIPEWRDALDRCISRMA